MEGAQVSRGRGAKFWILLAAVVLGIIFIAVNSQKVTVDFIVAQTEAPLIVALLIALAVGFVIGMVVARLRAKG
jgi:uncharacterized integral membrane protein